MIENLRGRVTLGFVSGTACFVVAARRGCWHNAGCDQNGIVLRTVLTPHDLFQVAMLAQLIPRIWHRQESVTAVLRVAR